MRTIVQKLRDNLSTPLLLVVIGLLLLHIHAVSVKAATLTTQAATQKAAQIINDVNTAVPVVVAAQQGVAGVQAAGNDPAAIISATAAAISQTTGAASQIPSPWAGYLAIAAIISGLISNLVQALFHKHNVATIVNSSSTPPNQP